MAQGLFLGGSGRRAAAQTRPAFPKMPRAPSAFSKKGRLGRQAINLASLRRVRAWRDGPQRLEDDGQDEPRPSVSRAITHLTRSVYQSTRPTEVCPSPATFKDCAYALVMANGTRANDTRGLNKGRGSNSNSLAQWITGIL